jgi:Rps23 Pro-64 3,4-dihydroxylase Tpa1-like proline 4-hydroxylase
MDDFLEAKFADQLLQEFPPLEAMPKSRDYVFGDKHELSSVEAAGAAGAQFHAMTTSDRFRAFLKDSTGFDVFVDEQFHGGGFHQGGDGGFLDTHVDFNVHPLHKTWLRTLNLLIYMNKDWKDEYGGHLLIKARPDDPPREIAPIFNRAVLMLTDDHTYHGFKKMALPPGVSRKSLATYAYQLIDEGEVRARTTGWVPEEAGLGKRLLARNYDTLVRLKNRWFGSRTSRNR